MSTPSLSEPANASRPSASGAARVRDLPGPPPEPWRSRLQRLTALAFTHPAAHVKDWEQLHRDAARQGVHRVAAAALVYAAWSLRCSGDVHRAEAAALRARRYAIRHGQCEQAFYAAEAHAMAQHLQGRHLPALAGLVELLGSREAAGVSTVALRSAWVRLAGFYADSGAWPLARDALTHAIALDQSAHGAIWRWETLSRSFAVALPVVMAGHPVYAQALRLPHEQPEAEAAEAVRCCSDALSQMASAVDAKELAGTAARDQAVARLQVMPRLDAALRGDLPSLHALASNPTQMSQGDRIGWWFERTILAFGWLVAQQPAQTLEVLQAWADGPLPGLPPVMYERASYLRFAALQQLGRLPEALAQYQRYATAAASRISTLQSARLPVPPALRGGSDTTTTTPALLLPPYLREVLRIMEANPAQDLHIESLATAVGVTSRTLRNAFRQHLATSPADHLTRLRLQRLHDRLTAEGSVGADLGALAAWAGFSSPARLVSLYREHYGTHPLA